MKRLLVLLLIFAALSAARPAAAQSNWEAWFYNPVQGSITRINPAGAVAGETFLPISQAFNSFGAHVAVSPSGRYVAFTMYDSTTGTANVQLSVYDLQIGAVRFNYDISGAEAVSFEFWRHNLAFDEANQQFAFGLSYGDRWEIVIANFATENVLASLDSASAGLEAVAVPLVTDYDGQFVTFALMDAPNGANYATYRWNIGTGEVTSDNVLISLGGDLLPSTGEIVRPVANDAYPMADWASAPVQNVLSVFDPAVGEVFPVYNDPDSVLNSAQFIEGGMRVLLQAGLSGSESAMIVVNRDGSVHGTLIGQLNQIYGTPDGFVGTFPSNPGLALAYVNTTDSLGQPQTLWAGGDSNWSLVHVSAPQGPATLPDWQPLD